MPKLRDRKVSVKVFRTIQIEGEGKFEFYKFELEDSGILLSEIASDEEARDVRTEMFGELNKEALLHEATVKASRKKEDIDSIVQLLKRVFENIKDQEKPDPPVKYYSDIELREDNNGGV
jgi:hypothetical protein